MSQTVLVQSILYLVSFVLIWVGAGAVVSAVSQLAKSWKLPVFIVSFFVLGILTSLPEMAIGTTAILNDDPVIMAGNLLGGVIVMFLGIIPLLAIAGNGVKMPSHLDKKQLIITLLVVVAPAFLTADQKLERWEATFLILLYLSLFVFFSFKLAFWQKVSKGLSLKRLKVHHLLVKIVLGVITLLIASNQIVNSTLFFADLWAISPFFVSLIVVAIGTNMPEISIMLRSVISGKKDVALADYLGSASANTLLLGIFTLMHGQTVQLPNHFFQRFSFLALGLILFFVFARSKNTLSRREGLVLFSLYVGFIVVEVLVGR